MQAAARAGSRLLSCSARNARVRLQAGHTPQQQHARTQVLAMASGPCCAAGQPVTHDYIPQGKTETLPGTDLQVYFVGPNNSKEGIVLIYDIFGAEFKQVYQVADRLSAAGFRVAVPDVFKGKPWPMAKFPPKPEDKLMDWITTQGAWSGHVGTDFRATKGALTAQGVTKVGVVGFCWGATISIEAAGAGLVQAAACCHPAYFGKEKALAEAAQSPVCILPAQGDAMEALKEVLDTKPFASKCVYKRFDDQTHGFMAARGDWTKPEVAAAATQGIEILTKFFVDNLKA